MAAFSRHPSWQERTVAKNKKAEPESGISARQLAGRIGGVIIRRHTSKMNIYDRLKELRSRYSKWSAIPPNEIDHEICSVSSVVALDAEFKSVKLFVLARRGNKVVKQISSCLSKMKVDALQLELKQTEDAIRELRAPGVEAPLAKRVDATKLAAIRIRVSSNQLAPDIERLPPKERAALLGRLKQVRAAAAEMHSVVPGEVFLNFLDSASRPQCDTNKPIAAVEAEARANAPERAETLLPRLRQTYKQDHQPSSQMRLRRQSQPFWLRTATDSRVIGSDAAI
jgi:hypothetical protein